MSIMDSEEQTNQVIIPALHASNRETTALVLTVPHTPPPGMATFASVTDNQPIHANIASLAQVYSVTNFKLQRILIRLDNASISNEGSCEVSIIVPNSHTSITINTSASEMEKFNYDPLTELDSHANIVFLGSNSFIFKSTIRA